ncbi:MAG: HD domain-containing protein [Proteobacteria bacterium]|nr:HD domain-containing protein [Pseudomonadota bacterium]
MIQLQVIYGRDAGKCGRFQQSVVHIGTDPGNDFQLTDPEVSEYHGQFTNAHEASYAYCDMLSARGTRVRSASIDVLLFSHQLPQSVALTGECTLSLGQSVIQCTNIPNAPPDSCGMRIQHTETLPLHTLSPSDDPKLLAFLLDISTALTSKTTYEAVMTHLAQMLMLQIPYLSHLSFWKYDSCQDAFIRSYERARAERITPNIFSPDDFRRVIRSRVSELHQAVRGQGSLSMIVAPIVTSRRELGVITADASEDQPFTHADLERCTRVACVSAYAIERTFVNADLSAVFDGFIRSLITVMDARDPASSGHSMRVAKYALFTAQAVHASQHPAFKNISFSNNHLDELRFAALLHDIGKVVLRREILLKDAKLTKSDLNHLLERLDLFAAWFQTQSPEKLGDDYRPQRRFEHYREVVTRVQLAQEKAAPEDIEIIDEMARTYIAPCPNIPLLSPQERESLLITKGTLNTDERREIQKHALISWQYLTQIAWPPRWANVPLYVLQHHEKLNGTGYPYGISGDQICLQSRIITVCDIFDALTGGDRSYKLRHSFGEAAMILRKEAAEGALDINIVELFIEQVLPQISNPELASGGVSASLIHAD